jgi:dipeptidyl aminopeptidase/acylaminoacyl peptidase
MFNALERLGQTVELAEYAGEGHAVTGWSLPNAVDAARRMLEFLDRHMK